MLMCFTFPYLNDVQYSFVARENVKDDTPFHLIVSHVLCFDRVRSCRIFQWFMAALIAIEISVTCIHDILPTGLSNIRERSI